MEPEVKQFKLADDGVIFFQPDPTNPMPGNPVGNIRKGDAVLLPAAEAQGRTFDNETLTAHLRKYINEILQPLTLLNDEEAIQQPARDIAGKLHDALGILPRSELEDPIGGLDDEGRSALRARKVRLGPVLVFLPLLNKPAAIRLRAILWNLWNDKPLPAAVPPDGVTSIAVPENDEIDKSYYRSIGYPVYGPRAIRVDMLDRLICEVYDLADKGVFQAQHKMAEWLGCPIADLYAVLEAMGHSKLHDPADEKTEEEGKAEEGAKEGDGETKVPVAEEKTETPKPEGEEKPAETKSETDAAKPEGEEKPKEEAKDQPQEKPELATFRLRKGRAYGQQPQRKPFNKDKKPGGFKKKQGGDKFKGKPKHKGKHKPREQKERVISAAAPKKNEAASPFDVLKDLKVQNKD